MTARTMRGSLGCVEGADGPVMLARVTDRLWSFEDFFDAI